MGNVRNPVGPLPSSIYWRRRAVVLCLFALLVALVVWAVTSVGSGGSAQNAAAPKNGRSPLPSITPGPSTSQTGITSEPGGPGSSAGAGSSGGPGGSSGATSGTGTGTGGTDGGAGGAGVSGPSPLPDASNLSDCSSPQVQLTVRSAQRSYDPGQQPKFVLAAVNSGATACKVNFGATAAVVTVLDSSGNHVWSTGDCPSNRNAYLIEVPAHGSAVYTLRWDMSKSTPQCGSHPGSGAGAGSYQVKVTESGIGSAHGSFVVNQYGS